MAGNAFTGYQCWNEKRISVVINKEAVSVDQATFMATHMPFSSITYLESPRQITDTSEANLLTELCTRAGDNQHTFAVIQGIPGTGKSHLIRWLRGRYAVVNQETGNNDVVLLIERASSSLRNTLLQIIQSGVFDEALFSDQIERLKSATAQLSQEGLADTVLNNLQVALGEVKLRESEQPSRRIQHGVEKFLLDYFIREELKKKGKPIDRIVRFLSGQDRTGLSNDEVPTFQADDFNFDVSFLHRIKNQQDGYLEAKDLADSLRLKPELRAELATYLNHLLTFAVGRTIALSADELKQMFYDLRRELRRQGHQLALFIEDIAVFTGLDAGLVDVMVTQHTGESNREFCRLLSVVGITDSYYNDRLPDNIKQRVTHRLTLNTSQSGQLVSHLLTDVDAVADLAARYLNAIRLGQGELDAWQRRGALPDRLPNKCASCDFRSTCYAAFGYVNISESGKDEALQVGLYPFNRQALWTMYSRIDASKTLRTPRTLLNNVLGYVLQSHGPKISQRQFPPIARELGSDFEPPTLVKPAQRTLIKRHSNSVNVADRVETLILFWGDRTVDTTVGTDGQQLVSGLCKNVFEAFGLPFIAGEDVPLPRRPLPQPEPLPPKPKPENPLAQDIERWRTGSQLRNYEKLAKELAELASNFIDWDAHGIPASLVDERLKQARFVIEGQAGKMARRYHLEFKRSDELALVLHALADLQESAQDLEQSKLGSHLATISSWMREQEPRIVEFVRQPNAGGDSPLSFVELLLQDNLLIACLSNGLKQDRTAPQDMFFESVEALKQDPPAPWSDLIISAQETHSAVWVRTMKRIERNANQCRHEFFPTFNCAQGRSTELRFIDAARVLSLLEEFTEKDWELVDIDIEPDGELWTTAVETYQALRQSFPQALTSDRAQIQDYQQRLGSLVSENSPEEVLLAISEFLKDLRQNQIGYSFEEKTALDAAMFERCLASLHSVPAEGKTVQLALWLSGSGQLVRDTKECLDYLDSFDQLVTSQEKQLAQKMQDLKSRSGGTPLGQRVEEEYEESRKLLDQILELANPKEKTQ
jgi:hypothetical protein